MVLFFGSLPFLLGQINVEVTFNRPEIKTKKPQNSNIEYEYISILDIQETEIEGSPSLPVKYIRLLLPPGKKASKIVINASSFEEGDLRKQGSIMDGRDPDEFNPDEPQYIWNGRRTNHETGYWQKKYVPIVVILNSASGDSVLRGMYRLIFGEPDNSQINNMQDEILIRFSDVLLMATELGVTNGVEYFNRVRTRAGLDPIASPDLDDIKIERRHELAFEGIRYFDLLRWQDVEQAFQIATNIPVKTENVDEIYTVTFRPETGGFIAIPESQVILSEGILEQNPGW